MPLPIIVALLAGKAAHSGAKKGAREGAEEAARSQRNTIEEPPVTRLPRATYANVSISITQRNGIDRLLSKAQYRVLNELHARIQEKRIEVNFYALVLREDRLIEFFEDYPALSQLFLTRVRTCIDTFLAELSSAARAEEAALLRHRQVRRQSVEQPSYNLSTAPVLVDQRTSKLYAIESAPSEYIKMDLLKAFDKDTQTIGHLCLGPHNRYNGRYETILRSLQPSNLLIILKLTNLQNKTIFSLYREAGLNVCDLLSECKEDPSVFCKIIEYFEIDNKTIQLLVNVRGLKGKIRNYLLNLPDEQANWDLLNRCLDQSTPIGNFCAKEANRTGLFQSGGVRVTVRDIRDKVSARVFPLTELMVETAVPVLMATAQGALPASSDTMGAYKLSANGCSVEVDNAPVVMMAAHQSSGASAPPWSPEVMFEYQLPATQTEMGNDSSALEARDSPTILSVNNNSEFWLYIGCATAIIASSIGLLYQYLNPPEENTAGLRL